MTPGIGVLAGASPARAADQITVGSTHAVTSAACAADHRATSHGFVLARNSVTSAVTAAACAAISPSCSASRAALKGASEK